MENWTTIDPTGTMSVLCWMYRSANTITRQIQVSELKFERKWVKPSLTNGLLVAKSLSSPTWIYACYPSKEY